ncbi:MAG: hypothetical protein EPO08_21295 [Rhodospirillaceae bacterium]|nr:MAG: hypothetical protein EPO08_21295 [Rhodospirillaceae bacterium]
MNAMNANDKNDRSDPIALAENPASDNPFDNPATPSVATIEMGLDAMKARDIRIVKGEIREFAGLGMARAQAALNSLPAVENAPDRNMLAGYLLGLETMRALAAQKGIAL